MRFHVWVLVSAFAHAALVGWLGLPPRPGERPVDLAGIEWAPPPEPAPAPAPDPPAPPPPEATSSPAVVRNPEPEPPTAASEILDRFETLRRRVLSTLERTEPPADPPAPLIAAGEPPRPPEPGNDLAAALRYVEEVVKPSLRAALAVPPRALRERMYGSAGIRIRVLADGTLAAAAFVQRSPFPLLDDAAHQAILRAVPLAPPAGYGLVEPLDVNCWFEFGRDSASVR